MTKIPAKRSLSNDLVSAYIAALQLGRLTIGAVDLAFRSDLSASAVLESAGLDRSETALRFWAAQLGAACAAWSEVENHATTAVMVIERRINDSKHSGMLANLNSEYRRGRAVAKEAGRSWPTYSKFRRDATMRILATTAIKVRNLPGGEFGNVEAATNGNIDQILAS